MLKNKNNLNNIFFTFSKRIIFSGISSIFLVLPVLAENKPDFVVSIKQLSYEFERNSIVAEDKYMNKTIKTTGIITSIDDTLLGDRWVSVDIEEPDSNSYSPGSISCLHIRSEPIIRELYKGLKVDIIGTITQEELGLTLKSCSYEEYRTSKEWYEIYGRKWKEKDFKGVVYASSKFIELNPKADYAFLARGAAKRELKDYQGAINDYNKAIELNPKNSVVFANRANAKRELKDYQGAINDLDKSIELNPKNVDALGIRAYTKGQLGDYEGEINDLNKAIELDPKNSFLFNNRGLAKWHLKDYQGAINDLDKSIELNPNNGNAFANRGQAKYLSGDFQGACSDFGKGSQYGDQNAVIRFKDKCK